MLLKDNKYRIAQLFFKRPTHDFFVREVSREAKVALPSTSSYLKELIGDGLILFDKNKSIFPTYRANRESDSYKLWKKLSITYELNRGGLLAHLVEKCQPDAIILFGSAARGEDIEGSDVDIAVIAKETKVDTGQFSSVFLRDISLHFHPHFKTLSAELKNNILNGVVLFGYLKVF